MTDFEATIIPIREAMTPLIRLAHETCSFSWNLNEMLIFKIPFPALKLSSISEIAAALDQSLHGQAVQNIIDLF